MNISSENVENIGVGVGYTLIAAAGYCVLIAALSGAWREGAGSAILQLLLVLAYGMVLSSWFVLPIGAVLGWFFPRHVLEVPIAKAMAAAVVAGILVGIVASSALLVMYRQSSFVTLLSVTIPYCIFATLIAAGVYRRRANGKS